MVDRNRKATRRVGLARALSKLGVCSRSQAFELIRAGRVRVNGRLVLDPEESTDLQHDRFAVDGTNVEAAEFTYYMMNKPRGLVTTASDEKGRETVYALLPNGLPWMAPVGRLDKASEGLLLLTNDSEWAARITDPSSHLDKAYHVQIAAIATEGTIRELELGLRVDGEDLKAKEARILRVGKKNAWLEIVLDEGKNRQIRRMLEAMKVEVLRLIRVAIGPLQLGELPKGGCRLLTTREKAALDSALPPFRSQR